MCGIEHRSSHGQLYVACSRVSSGNQLRYAVRVDKDGEAEKVPNWVFREVLPELNMYMKDDI